MQEQIEREGPKRGSPVEAGRNYIEAHLQHNTSTIDVRSLILAPITRISEFFYGKLDLAVQGGVIVLNSLANFLRPISSNPAKVSSNDNITLPQHRRPRQPW